MFHRELLIILLPFLPPQPTNIHLRQNDEKRPNFRPSGSANANEGWKMRSKAHYHWTSPIGQVPLDKIQCIYSLSLPNLAIWEPVSVVVFVVEEHWNTSCRKRYINAARLMALVKVLLLVAIAFRYRSGREAKARELFIDDLWEPHYKSPA